jgi:addiction module HigA family antidote
MARTPIHPGELLHDELEAAGLSAAEFARRARLPETRIAEILACRQPITADAAYGLATVFGTSAELWLNLQTTYERDLADAAREQGGPGPPQ